MKLPITRMKRHLNTSTKVGKGTLPTGDLWECVENGKVQEEFNFFVNFCHGEVEVEIF